VSPRVALTRPGLPGAGPDRLAAVAEVVMPSADPPDRVALLRLVEGASAVIALGNDLVDAELLDSAGSALRVVALCSAGYDRVEVTAARARGVVVTHTPGILGETTADLAFALILAARRRLGAARDALLAGQWDAFRMTDFLGLDVHGAVLGLVGYGEIGRAVARRARGFDMRVLYHDARPADPGDDAEPVDLPTLLERSDVVSLHVPLTPETRHLIDAAALARMKPTATLVNSSRGPVVDLDAVLAALRAGRLHSAGVDVFDREPLGADVAHLRAEGRLFALPHIGSATLGTRAAMVDLAVRNVEAVLSGAAALTPLPGTAGRPVQVTR
jgi:lactate dehydrogenase-like 2-hydroxyacid dehydrogenase